MDIYDMEPICLKMGRAYIHSQEQSYDEIMDAYFELQQKNNAFYENNICNNLKNVNINGIKFKSINNEEEYEDFIKQGQQEYNMNINKKEQC